MTKRERELVKRAIRLFLIDDGFDAAMECLHLAVKDRAAVARIRATLNLKPISIQEALRGLPIEKCFPNNLT
jgi:hypothetical protein